MIYKEHEIVVECITERAVYTLTDDGEVGEYENSIDSELEVYCYGVLKDGDYLEWTDTIEQAKEFIDKETA